MTVQHEDRLLPPPPDDYRFLSPSYRQLIENFLLNNKGGQPRKIDCWVRQLGDQWLMEIANEILEKERTNS